MKVKRYQIVFITVFSLIVLMLAFYWSFANYASPIVLGMPFGMFVIVLLILIEFISLLVFYYFDEIRPNSKKRL